MIKIQAMAILFIFDDKMYHQFLLILLLSYYLIRILSVLNLVSFVMLIMAVIYRHRILGMIYCNCMILLYYLFLMFHSLHKINISHFYHLQTNCLLKIILVYHLFTLLLGMEFIILLLLIFIIHLIQF